jgi:hypothetical protein
MKTVIAIAFSVFALTGCERSGGRVYIRELGDAIRSADKIVVAEHSHDLDVFDEETGRSLVSRQLVYGVKELSKGHREKFLSTIERLDPKTQDEFPACIFEPHHSVSFYSRGEILSTMEICFVCGQLSWDATKATPPWSIYPGLASFIKAIGFEPERDWSTVARDHMKAVTDRSNKLLHATAPSAAREQ